MNNIITYRGAKANESEVRVPQHEQQQSTRLVQYRGTKGEAAIGYDHKIIKVSYRGASAEIDL